MKLRNSLEIDELVEEARSLIRPYLERVRDYVSLRSILLASVVLASAYFFTQKALMVLMAVTVLVFSHFTSKYNINRFGLELSSFFTITTGYALGPETGAVFGLILITLQAFSGGAPGFYILWVIPSYGLAGYLAGTYSSMPLSQIGPMLVAGFQTFFLTMTVIFSRGYTVKYFQYAVFNFAINTTLFSRAGGLVISVLTAS